ncbi:MAG: ABC transporter ATP-binding protein [Flavobacteriales bacterium]
MIEVQNLSKKFEEINAVKNISFSIKEGEIFGFLGPNGAGKTTTLNMLSGLLQSDEGSIQLNGFDIKKDPILCKKSIGVIPQEIALYDEFSAYDNLMFWGKLYNVPTKTLKKNIYNILKLIGLEDRKDDLIKTYSGGMKRRINIASALLHEPKILFMDEPTVGVDPQSRNRIFEIVETLNQQGMTIIYTTHYMEEAERLCNRIAIIDNGKIVSQGTLDELQKQSNAKEMLILKFETISQKKLQELSTHLSIKSKLKESTILFECDINKNLSNIINACNKTGLIIEDIKVRKLNLEAIFLQLTGKQLRD